MYPCKTSRSMRVMGLVLLLALLLSQMALAAPAPQEPSVTAASAIVMDYDTGEVLYEKDADTMRVPASMTKIMTAYIIFEELEAGNLTLDTMVPISAANAQSPGTAAITPPQCPSPPGPPCRWTPCSG
ncbi:D-alanyl-D-alanine carboxypeptidase [Flavonifractor sp. AGMB03687]|uniref:D-alanyl-D-alanine carboxypeptidase n=1 Tax=Flavonifractor sp. AGMB03687 TaxID=2785133 RepID=UPI001ADFB9DD|nr:D-alanyl-D-alanine carboxypeptidase [Flavonifractor sp. AGMB03687]